MQHYGLFIGGEEIEAAGGERLPVIYPYTGEAFATVSLATAADVARAVGAAEAAFREHLRGMPAHERARLLMRTAEVIADHRAEFTDAIAHEAGKPLKDVAIEAGRGGELFVMAAGETRDIAGELLPMDAIRGGEGRWGMVLRQPLGVVAAIGPFNAPLNLVAQKVAPALAAGNSVVVKPASKTPIAAVLLARCIHEAGWPAGACNVVIGPGPRVGDPLVQDPRVRMVSFTGGTEAGRRIHERAGLKRVTLELGSNAPNVVCADANLAQAAAAITRSGFSSAGQQCISAQRVYVQREVQERFTRTFLDAIAALKVGDPFDPDCDVGPMISEDEARRVETWIGEAKAAGARVLVGGKREGALLSPTVVTDTRPDMRVQCQEVFAPLVTLTPFDTVDEVLALANDSPYGLQAAAFTNDLNTALRFARELESGCIWINEGSRYRQDNYPFGGVKDSGLGREGVKYAIQEMTEVKFVGIKT
ncbi:MAG TPA: aldehyde dehydrogenase family protein [Chloroflexota bacterium]|jgi:acyl-CoA reductase-like NAD-dependent aldehyde dehydrogenase